MTIDSQANKFDNLSNDNIPNNTFNDVPNNRESQEKVLLDKKTWSSATTCVAIAAGIFSGGYFWGIPFGLLAGTISHNIFSNSDPGTSSKVFREDVHSIYDDGNGNSISYSFNDYSTGIGGYLLSYVNSNYEGSVTEGKLLFKINNVAFTIFFNLNNKQPVSDLQLAHLLIWLSAEYEKGEIEVEVCRNIFLAMHCHIPNRRGRAKSDKSFITKQQFEKMYEALGKNENFIDTAYRDFLMKV